VWLHEQLNVARGLGLCAGRLDGVRRVLGVGEGLAVHGGLDVVQRPSGAGRRAGGDHWLPWSPDLRSSQADPPTKVSSEAFVWFSASEMMMMMFAAEIGAVVSSMMGSYRGEPNRS
jgi:hypothetical protein